MRTDAAPCSTSPDDWFDPSRYEQAAAVCARCPIAAACLEGAVARGETHGLWGARVFDIEDAAGFLLAEMPEPVVAEVEHGRRGNDCRCARCKAAHARYIREWRNRPVSQMADAGPQQLTFEGMSA